MSPPAWFPRWAGETCVIVASGPSASDVPIEQAKGAARFIAVNRSIDLCPWADVWYGCDFEWWKSVGGGVDFAGLKLSVDRRATREQWGIMKVDCRRSDDRLFLDPLNTIGWAGNSGFHCLNLAVQFGCKKIILVGFDMTVEQGLHWHGEHPAGLNNPKRGNVARWRRATDNAAKVIAGAGVTVINCSPVSALENYPKMGFEEALAV